MVKTKHLIINNQDRPQLLNIKIGDSVIEKTDVHNSIGIHIHEKLNFVAHTINLQTKNA